VSFIDSVWLATRGGAGQNRCKYRFMISYPLSVHTLTQALTLDIQNTPSMINRHKIGCTK
jgi:hypothetical protein